MTCLNAFVCIGLVRACATAQHMTSCGESQWMLAGLHSANKQW